MMATRHASARILLRALMLYLIVEAGFIFSGFSPSAINLYAATGRLRERFPFSTAPHQEDRALDVGVLDTLFASHVISRPKAADEFRVVLIGDSATWGAPLPPSDSLSSQINALELTCAGKHVIAYNPGFPEPSAIKDLMILAKSLEHRPDLVIWSVTLLTLTRRLMALHPMLPMNPGVLNPLNDRFQFLTTKQAAGLFRATISQRQVELFRTLRFQFYLPLEVATGIDQIQDDSARIRHSLGADTKFAGMRPPHLRPGEIDIDLTNDFLAEAADVPVLIVNEPIAIIEGVPNSDVRYNSYIPRWAYDQYRQFMSDAAAEFHWQYLDLWDFFAADYFTNTPFHLNARGEQLLSQALAPSLLLNCRP